MTIQELEALLPLLKNPDKIKWEGVGCTCEYFFHHKNGNEHTMLFAFVQAAIGRRHYELLRWTLGNENNPALPEWGDHGVENIKGDWVCTGVNELLNAIKEVIKQ